MVLPTVNKYHHSEHLFKSIPVLVNRHNRPVYPSSWDRGRKRSEECQMYKNDVIKRIASIFQMIFCCFFIDHNSRESTILLYLDSRTCSYSQSVEIEPIYALFIFLPNTRCTELLVLQPEHVIVLHHVRLLISVVSLLCMQLTVWNEN